MQQLDLARQHIELGRYQLAFNTYKASLLTLKDDLKRESNERKTRQLIELIRVVEKELETLQVLINETKNIKVAPATPETPSDPMVWAPPPPKPSKLAMSKVAKPPVPSQRKPTDTRSAPRKAFGSSSSTPKSNHDTPKGGIRRINSQPRLDDVSYNTVLNESKDSDVENGEKLFDSSMYDRELVQLIERSVIQRNPNITWNDISGLENTKKTLTEAALLPQIFPTYFKGIRRPWKGVCLFGPPGTGKTMLAKAVATECKSTFFSVSASTFASKWRGDGEKLVRLLFEMARFHAPSTIFIDELDTLCSKRGSDSEHEASKRMKGELLVQIDGMNDESERSVLLLAATNCPWELDEAFRRRLEKRIYVGLPDKETRLLLLKNCLCSVKLGDDVKLDELAAKTDGYSGADITNLCRDAALQPMRECLDNLEDYKAAGEQLSASFLEEKPIRMAHFNSAMLRVKSSCSPDTIKRMELAPSISLPHSCIPTVSGVTSSKLIVNRKQQGNPVLKYVRAVPYEWSSDIRPDYLCGMCGILYLTLKWHKLHPSYLETRLNDLNVFDMKIILVLNNVEDPSYLLKDLNILCYRSRWTMIVSHSVEEAGEYIENLKLSERRNPADAIRAISEYRFKRKNDGKPMTLKEKNRQNYESAVKFLSCIKSVTVSDAKRLLGSFGSIQTISKCSVDQLNLCPGLGPTKSQRLYDFFRLSLINIKSK